MKIAVFEDDRTFADKLEILIRQFTHHPTTINTGVGTEIINWVTNKARSAEPTLYLLDIVSNGKTTGFQIAKQIVELSNSSLIVFMTAYPQKIKYNATYKTKAFSVILKDAPSLEAEIKETIALAEQVFLSKCLYIHFGKSETLYIPYDKICFVESIKGTNKLCIHCVDGQYVIRETLKTLQEQLTPFGFVRCHKSIIVNKSNIRKRDKSSMTLTLNNGASCPYSYLMKGGLDGIE